ncbi:hypothetical protein PHYBOEH_000917 [Phytophthora boehmeriae]|uniref:Uncharacterized protein n=1 Tax=Phytophthora boehmeriae TaxID=109152 RepID=A0A8T1VBA9_9STRA|nr:hypothetical protein PHYBOEH_000917 [Phytophthora boehmeriae]
MVEDAQMDDDFLAALEDFLSDCSVPIPSMRELPSENGSGVVDEKMIHTDNEVLAETETLLASWNSDDNLLATYTGKPAEVVSRGHESPPDTQQKQAIAKKRREARNAQAAERRRKLHHKVKAEKIALTQMKSELSEKLAKLESTRALAKVESKPANTLALGAWKTIAMRQMEQRFQAEEQQRQLRTAVVNQSRIIHQMNNFLQQSLANDDTDGIMPRDEQKSSETKDGAAVLATFMSELDSLYGQTDSMFVQLEMKISSPLAYGPTPKAHQGVEYFDAADLTVIPFCFEGTCRALSTIIISDPEGSTCNQCIADPNTAAFKNTISHRLESGDVATMASYTAARRYKEADRVVFVWRALTEGQGNYAGLHADETAWVVVCPAPAGQAGWTTNSTIVQSYARLVPVGFNSDPESESDRQARDFAKIVAQSGQEDVKVMMDKFEKLLLS